MKTQYIVMATCVVAIILGAVFFDCHVLPTTAKTLVAGGCLGLILGPVFVGIMHDHYL